MVNVVAGVIMAVLVVAFIVIYFKVIRQSAMTHEEEPMTMQDLLGISEIRDGVVSIGENRHCKVIAVGSINYHLMSDEERDRVEGAFGSLLASLSFPIQIYVQTMLLDLSHAIEDLSRDIENAPRELQPYGLALKNHLQNWIGVRSVMLRHPYVVVICENDNYREARRDLEHRQQMVVEGLARCGLYARCLNNEEIADLFYAIYNSKTRALIAPLRNALGASSSMYVRGVPAKSKAGGGLLEAESEKEQARVAGQ